MAIKTIEEFEESLAKVGRLYRALQDIWSDTHPSEEAEIAKWVAAGGAIMEKLDETLAEIEDFTGTGELRVIWDRLKAMRQEKQSQAAKEG